MRVTGRMRNKSTPGVKELTTAEIKSAELRVINMDQEWSYADVKSLLARGKTVPKRHSLGKYKLRLDEHGTMRLQGRVK